MSFVVDRVVLWPTHHMGGPPQAGTPDGAPPNN